MKRKTLLSLAAVLVLALLAVNSTYIVTPDSRVLVIQFGRIVSSDAAPGLHFKLPFVQNVVEFDSRLLTLDNQTQTFSTADKKDLQVSYFVKWRIDDVRDYYQATGGQELVAMDRLSAVLNRGLRDEFASASESDALETSPGDLLQHLGAEARKQVADLGVKLVDLRVRNIQLPQDVLDSVYDRMRAERQRVAASLRAQGQEASEQQRSDADSQAADVLAQARAEAEKIRGEGDAKASKIYTDAYSQDPEFFRFYRSLNAYRDALSNSGDVLVLKPDSEFFRYFRDGRVAK